MSEKRSNGGMTRRKFIGNVTLTTAAFSIVPRHVLGGKGYTAPSDKLNIAIIGAGGKGKSDMWSVAATENIVALCDVDDRKIAETLEKTKEEEGKEELAKVRESSKV